MSTFRLFFTRELQLLFGNREALIQPIFFFLITISLFPFSLGNDERLLTLVMPAVVWVAIVLAIMMSLPQLFRADHDDGSLEQWLLGRRSLTLIILAKSTAHWLCNGFLLSILACLVCYVSDIPWVHIKILFVSLLLGSICLQLIGGVGAALTVTLRQSGLLIAVIVLPLFIPILIFGAGAVARSIAQESVTGALYMLAAITSMTITLSPFGMSFALKNITD